MALQVGDKAPDFAVNDQDGMAVKLSELKGKKIILYFYPKDMTPGCTAEACSLRDNYKAMRQRGYEILGVSSDNEKSHRKFADKEKLPFRLLADTSKTLHEAYGTWVEKSMYGRKYMGTARVTFVIDENGVIREIISKVDTKNHAAQILKDVEGASSKIIAIPISKRNKVRKTVKNPVKKLVKKSSSKAAKKSGKK